MFVQTLSVLLTSILVLINQFDRCVSLNEPNRQGESLDGGNLAPAGAFPFQISLRNNSNSHFCGGALISERWVLSAASCVYNKLPNEILIVVGAESIRDGTIYTCENLTSHEQFDFSTRQNNIAVLKTSRDVLNSTLVRPTFYYRGGLSCNYPCTTSGWGDIENGGAQFLEYFNVTTVSNAGCNAMFLRLNSFQEISLSTQNVCVFETPKERIICHGDEGAPLFSSREIVVVGILSYSACIEKIPVVFTMTGAYDDWIFAKTMIPGSTTG